MEVLCCLSVYQIVFAMELSLEEDDASELFITQTPHESLVDAINEQDRILGSDVEDFEILPVDATLKEVPLDVPHYSDISDEEVLRDGMEQANFK